MIDETVQRVQKELKLVTTEGVREENTLTTELWKKTVETFIFLNNYMFLNFILILIPV